MAYKFIIGDFVYHLNDSMPSVVTDLMGGARPYAIWTPTYPGSKNTSEYCFFTVRTDELRLATDLSELEKSIYGI